MKKEKFGFDFFLPLLFAVLLKGWQMEEGAWIGNLWSFGETLVLMFVGYLIVWEIGNALDAKERKMGVNVVILLLFVALTYFLRVTIWR